MGRLKDFFKAFMGTEISNLDENLSKEEEEILAELKKADNTGAIEKRISEKYRAIVNTRRAKENAAKKSREVVGDGKIRTNE